MNKFFLFFTLLFCSLSLLQAQDQLRYGLKAGANLSGYHTENSAKTDLFGYQFGGVINYQSNSLLALQAELNFTKKGGGFHTYEYTNFSAEFIGGYTETQLTYIEIPLTVQLIFLKKFRLETGPQISFLINDQTTYRDEEVDVELNVLDFGLTGGLTYTFGEHFFLQARYTYGLSEVYSEPDRYKNSVVSLALGYLF